MSRDMNVTSELANGLQLQCRRLQCRRREVKEVANPWDSVTILIRRTPMLEWCGMGVRCGHVFERNWTMCATFDNHPRRTKPGGVCYMITTVYAL